MLEKKTGWSNSSSFRSCFSAFDAKHVYARCRLVQPSLSIRAVLHKKKVGQDVQDLFFSEFLLGGDTTSKNAIKDFTWKITYGGAWAPPGYPVLQRI